MDNGQMLLRYAQERNRQFPSLREGTIGNKYQSKVYFIAYCPLRIAYCFKATNYAELFHP
jgi:hypothetical protein